MKDVLNFTDSELSLQFCARAKPQGRVVRKPINANPGLKFNRSIDFSCINLFFTAYVLCSLRFFKIKTEEKTI